MARIFRERGFIGEIWPNDHLPAHVHVFKAEFEAVIAIGNERGPYLISPRNMRAEDIRSALKLVAKYRQEAITKWEELHG